MAVEQRAPARATSAWSALSWLFFGLALLSALAFGACWLAFRSAAGDPAGGSPVGIPMLVGAGAAWGAACACSLIGSALGLLGVRRPAHRTRLAWAALALNGAAALVTTALIFILG
jgi:hypothetical protein